MAIMLESGASSVLATQNLTRPTEEAPPLLRNTRPQTPPADVQPIFNEGARLDENSDAVFDAGNFLTISLDQNNIYSNTQGQFEGIETQSDVPDPDLDIVDWSIQVTRP